MSCLKLIPRSRAFVVSITVTGPKILFAYGPSLYGSGGIPGSYWVLAALPPPVKNSKSFAAPPP